MRPRPLKGHARTMQLRVNLNRRGYALACIAILAVFLWLTLTSVAFGFPPPVNTPPYTTYSCAQCHADDSQAAPATGSGPHKNYATTTNKCVVCHKVHNAPAGGTVLTPGATVSATCLTCHDGTASGIGPYDSIERHAGVVTGEHTVDATKVIPGGSDELAVNLACSHCHSVHGANTVVPFLRDSGFAGTTFIGGADAYVTSDCLLRSDVGGVAAGTYPEYGALWCASCHDQRHSENTSGVLNHPVDNVPTWGYDDVVSSLTINSWRVGPVDGSGNAIGMGRTNGGYTMPPAPEVGDGRVITTRDPMCQQCHEDARNVEGVFNGDYTFRGTDPWNLHTNPAFLTFPHQTTNARMLVETSDDLCLNCHSTALLP